MVSYAVLTARARRIMIQRPGGETTIPSKIDNSLFFPCLFNPGRRPQLLIPNPLLLSRPHRAPARSPPLILARRQRGVRREPPGWFFWSLGAVVEEYWQRSLAHRLVRVGAAVVRRSLGGTALRINRSEAGGRRKRNRWRRSRGAASGINASEAGGPCWAAWWRWVLQSCSLSMPWLLGVN
jgi:hypothetical protein